MKYNSEIYDMNLYTLAESKDKMICKHCGSPIILCDRCGGSRWTIIPICIGKGFVHAEKGHFHHCRGTSNTVAFPVLTDEEKRRLDRYKGVSTSEQKEEV